MIFFIFKKINNESHIIIYIIIIINLTLFEILLNFLVINVTILSPDICFVSISNLYPLRIVSNCRIIFNNISIKINRK